MPSLTHHSKLLVLCTIALLHLAACGGGDSRPPAATQQPADDGQSVSTPAGPVDGGSAAGNVDNGRYRLELSATRFSINEGGNSVGLTLSVDRMDGHSAPIKLSINVESVLDQQNLQATIDDDEISGAETETEVLISLGVGRAPIEAHTREIKIVADDGESSVLEATITLNVVPTDAPDVYLLIGQSNMVGFSLPGAREDDVGEDDAPNSRVLQLNVTGNDDTNFPSPAAFTNPNSVANPDQRLVTALDPLHDGFDFSIDGKEATRIGLGLSFAKAMLPSTSVDVVLVPAAWSDTGFCKTDTLIFPTVGWHATPPEDTDLFSGTLLYDRAITRLNLTLQETNGIFRGILWHQGEADSNSNECAAAYEENLVELVAAIRTRAQVDGRGRQARGAAADVPFVAGTMSRGDDFADLSPAKLVVDTVHRNVSTLIPFAGTVNNDNFVPPAYPCGQGGCVHFGDNAYREIGVSYAEIMRSVQRR